VLACFEELSCPPLSKREARAPADESVQIILLKTHSAREFSGGGHCLARVERADQASQNGRPLTIATRRVATRAAA